MNRLNIIHHFSKSFVFFNHRKIYFRLISRKMFFELFEVDEEEVPAAANNETPPRYPRRHIQRKNYKELEMPDEDHFLCKFHPKFYHKLGLSSSPTPLMD